MKNETMIEALEYGLKLELTLNKNFHLSCSHMFCKDCKFENSLDCGFVVLEENIEFLKEKYPEYLLKV